MASKLFMVDINLDQNEIQNALIHPVVADPGTPKAGQMWFRSDTKELKYFDGTATHVIATGGNLVNAVTRATAAAAANELVVSGGADRSVTVYDPSLGTGETALIKINEEGVISNAIPGTDFLVPSNISAVVTRDAEPVAGKIAISVGGTDTRKLTNLTGTGIVKLTDGVAGMATAGVDYVTKSSEDTFTNKSFDAEGTGNSITNLKVSNFKAGVVLTVIGPTATDNELATAKAINDLINSKVAAFGQFVGEWDASGGTLPTTGSGAGGAIIKGDWWRISVTGTITDLGELEQADVIVAKINGADTGAEFFALQGNISGAVTSSVTSTTATQIAIFDGISGKVIKNSLATIAVDGSINIPAGTTYKVNGVNIMTAVTKKFAAGFIADAWSNPSPPYTLSILATTHLLGSTADIVVQVRNSSNDIVETNVNTSGDGTVTLISNKKFAGYVVLIG